MLCNTYLLVDAFQVICITVSCGYDLYGHQLPSGLVPGLVHRAIGTPSCRRQHMAKSVHEDTCNPSLLACTAARCAMASFEAATPCFYCWCVCRVCCCFVKVHTAWVVLVSRCCGACMLLLGWACCLVCAGICQLCMQTCQPATSVECYPPSSSMTSNLSAPSCAPANIWLLSFGTSRSSVLHAGRLLLMLMPT